MLSIMDQDAIFHIRLVLQVAFSLCLIWSSYFSIKAAIHDRSTSSWILAALFGTTALWATTQIASPILALCCRESLPQILPYLNIFYAIPLVLCLLAWGFFLLMRESAKLSHLIRIFGTSESDMITELQRTKDVHENVERLLNDQYHFLRAAAHDLRAPLRSISGFVSLIEEEIHQPPNPEYIAFIGKACGKMSALIDDLSILGRIETEHLAHEWIDMNVLIAETVALFNGDSDKVSWHDLPRVWGVRVRLGQLFQNLIGNALKFDSSHVYVIGEQRDRTVLMGVCDDGIGIPPEYHLKIFEQFQRLNKEEEYPGTGIGLTICQKIVNQHGGKIWLESEGIPGKGTRFFVLLPNEKK